MNLKTIWRIWAKSLGQKDGKNDTESDCIAIVRTVILIIYLITNFCIVINVLRHW